MIENILNPNPLATRRNLKAYNLIHGTNYTLDDLNIFTYISRNFDNDHVLFYGTNIDKDYNIKELDTKYIIEHYNLAINIINTILNESCFEINDTKSYIMVTHNVYGIWLFFSLRYSYISKYKSKIDKLSELNNINISNIFLYAIIIKYFKLHHISDNFRMANTDTILNHYSEYENITKEEVTNFLLNTKK